MASESQIEWKTSLLKNDLGKLTKCMPPIISTEPIFEIEEGKKKKKLGVASYEICDLIRFDLDPFLEIMVSTE